MMSFVPPGGKPTMKRTGRDGKPGGNCAQACAAAPSKSPATTILVSLFTCAPHVMYAGGCGVSRIVAGVGPAAGKFDHAHIASRRAKRQHAAIHMMDPGGGAMSMSVTMTVNGRSV